VLLGNGNGTFAVHKDSPTGGTPSTYASYSIVAADFNGDGKLDLALDDQGDSIISILLGNGDGTFTLQPPISASSFLLSVGDFNLDGKADIAVANNRDLKISMLLGNGKKPAA
jgi:hypothetical protein